jgi:hypothetical protein
LLERVDGRQLIALAIAVGHLVRLSVTSRKGGVDRELAPLTA